MFEKGNEIENNENSEHQDQFSRIHNKENIMSDPKGSNQIAKKVFGAIFGFILGATGGTFLIPYAGTILGGIVGAVIFAHIFSQQ